MKNPLSVGEAHDAWTRRRRAKRKNRGPKEAKSASRIAQPIIEATATVLCHLCHFPVDPRRMQPHMVRFHGAVLQ